MKWLIDEMLPPTVADELRDRGHDAVAVLEMEMQGAPDADVFELAVKEQRVVVTENFADFAALVEQHQTDNKPSTPVVFVRKSSLPPGGALLPSRRSPRRLGERQPRSLPRAPLALTVPVVSASLMGVDRPGLRCG